MVDDSQLMVDYQDGNLLWLEIESYQRLISLPNIENVNEVHASVDLPY